VLYPCPSFTCFGITKRHHSALLQFLGLIGERTFANGKARDAVGCQLFYDVHWQQWTRRIVIRNVGQQWTGIMEKFLDLPKRRTPM